MSPSPLYESTIHSLPLLSKGKVRDIYAINDEHLLMLTTDRLSAFDVVLEDPIPQKGVVLNQMALFWFEHLKTIIPNHLTGIAPESVVAPDERDQVTGRAIVAKRLQPIAIEAVVRGYLVGSGWQDYQATGKVCGITLPTGLQLASQLPHPIFTPAYKAEMGAHDENIDFDTMCEQIGDVLAAKIRDISLKLYQMAAIYAQSCGIIIADTKFEFGLDKQGELHLMDEVLTADSSRFWPLNQYVIGKNPPSFDKQFVRDWLSEQNWGKTPPAPRLPQAIIDQTAEKYQEAYKRLCAKN